MFETTCSTNYLNKQNSNLVGRITRNFVFLEPLNSCCCLNFYMIGNEKANVFPDPVLSLALISFPSNIIWKVLYCIGKSSLIPLLFNILMTLSSLINFFKSPGWSYRSSTVVYESLEFLANFFVNWCSSLCPWSLCLLCIPNSKNWQ